MNAHLLERIRACPNLPSLPAIAMQVLELAQKQEVDIGEIARVISKDPALSGKILRTVNSSFYGRAQAVSTVSHALVILGLQSVKTLVLGFSLVSNLSKSKSKGFQHLTYWRRSMYAATAARSIASKLGIVQQEEAFLCGLLADIGMLVLDQVLGEEYGEIVQRAKSHHGLAAIETSAFEMTHAAVSHVIAEQWKLPPLLSTPISAHHEAASVTDPQLRKLAEVVQLASRCADVFVDADAAQAITDVRHAAKAVHGLDSAVADALLSEIGTKTKEIAPLFEINLGSLDNYENILKRANEALVQLTLQSQVETHALLQQNAQLKQQALLDRLTGLSNRAGFDQKSQALWGEAQATGTTLCLLMIDLDHFKAVNDQHGHPAGDDVLRAVSKCLRAAARPQDVAARYGGEELALLLPDTPRAIATVIAETVRKSVQGRPVHSGGAVINVTASIGIASWEPNSPLKTLAHLVKAADLSLYNAKHSGRNRVKVFNPAPAKAA
ncbi:MAG TPA: HDOD domain-containing protein [Tepidisphaeraceae bacterium]|jgi:diguanylate cyclase (GGDEF)-like protein